MIAANPCPECRTELPSGAPEGLCPQCLLKQGLEQVRETPSHGMTANTDPFRGTFAAPDTAVLARDFPQLELLELLGKGGMGAVYKARQIKLDRLVALKILPVEASRDPAFAERFMREAKALARLNHPNIVTIYDFGESGGLFYFLMEYVDGSNLRQLLNSGQLTQEQSLKIIAQVCDALGFAHEQEIVHRDIKPENILIDRHGRAKIADFGLAKLVGLTPSYLTLTGSHQIMGTLYYMAPEQMERPQGVDRRADIYSLGVVLYEMLTGELPLGRFANPSQKVKSDPRLDPVILRALAREPDERYQNVNELKEAMAGIGHGLPTAMPVGGSAGVPGTGVVTLRFTTSALAGFGHADGMIHFDGAALKVEFIVRDSLGGLIKFKLKEVRIPIADIASITVSKKWFTTSLVITAARMGLLQEVPGAHHGQVQLRIARKEVKAAEFLVSTVIQRAFHNTAAVSNQPQRTTLPVTAFDREMLRLEVQGAAAGLVVIALLSFIAYVLIFTLVPLERAPIWRNLGPASIGSEYPGLIVLPLTLSILMIVGALTMRRFRAYELALVAALLAVLPWSPVWPIGFFVGLGALAVLRKPAVKAAFAHTADPQALPPPGLTSSVMPLAPPGKGVVGRFRSFFHSVGRYCFDTVASRPPSDGAAPTPASALKTLPPPADRG